MRLISTLTLLAGLSVAAAGLAAQDQNPTRNVPDSLVAKAKISEDSARAIATKKVPGTVQSTTLQSRRGRLSYVFGIQRASGKGSENVTVSASTGHVLSVARVSAKAKSKSTTHRSS